MKKLNVGVIGAGRIGKLHIDNILSHLPCFAIQCVADPYLDDSWAQTKMIPHFSHDAYDVFNDETIKAVLICSSSNAHAEHIIAAARAGKHIFCEKPIATDLTQIQQVLQVVEQANVILQVGFNRRFDPNFAKIKQSLLNHCIGTPHLLRITSRDPEIPPVDYIKTSSGMFLDMTIHDFDMARFLIDSDITEIYASANVLIDPVFKEYNDIDTAIINLKFANGCLGVIDNSRQAVYGYDQRVEVFGSLGAIQADNNKPTNTTLSLKQGIISEKPLRFFLERYKESYLAELDAFYQCVMHEKPLTVSGRDGLLSAALCHAAQQSLQENRPIKMDYQPFNA